MNTFIHSQTFQKDNSPCSRILCCRADNLEAVRKLFPEMAWIRSDSYDFSRLSQLWMAAGVRVYGKL